MQHLVGDSLTNTEQLCFPTLRILSLKFATHEFILLYILASKSCHTGHHVPSALCASTVGEACCFMTSGFNAYSLGANTIHCMITWKIEICEGLIHTEDVTKGIVVFLVQIILRVVTWK